MKNYLTVPNFRLRELCIEHNWFTCGTCEQYDKLFLMNEDENENYSIGDVITCIWLCSDEKWSRREIIDLLWAEMVKYH